MSCMQNIPLRETTSLHKRISSIKLLEQKLAAMLFETAGKQMVSCNQSHRNELKCHDNSNIKINHSEKETK